MTLLVGPPTSADAQQSPFINVIMQAQQGDEGGCREGIVEHRLQEWYGGPSVMPAFATVEEIMADITDPVEVLEAQGCNREFLWAFLACTRLDDPTLTHIVPRGVTAETDIAFEAVMMDCLSALDDAGIAARD